MKSLCYTPLGPCCGEATPSEHVLCPRGVFEFVPSEQKARKSVKRPLSIRTLQWCAGKTFFAGQEAAEGKVESEDAVRHAPGGRASRAASDCQRCQDPNERGKEARNGLLPDVFVSTFDLAKFPVSSCTYCSAGLSRKGPCIYVLRGTCCDAQA